MKKGIELIAEERQEQIEKHDRTVEEDVIFNTKGQLSVAAGILSQQFIPEGMYLIPKEWNEIIWIKMLGVGMPKNLVLREIFGIILSLAYILVIPPWFSKAFKAGRELFNNLGATRYYIFMFLVLMMTSLPIKMVLRWLFSLKYIVALPEWELNL